MTASDAITIDIFDTVWTGTMKASIL